MKREREEARRLVKEIEQTSNFFLQPTAKEFLRRIALLVEKMAEHIPFQD